MRRLRLREKGLARETGSLRVSLLALRRFAAPAHAARQRLCQAVHLNLGLPLGFSARCGGQGAGSLHLFEERNGRVRESDASGDTPRGSLRNHALARLIGTNHGPTGFPYRELAWAGARRPAFALN
jgi:hypothetical protein